ncbi:hypothetical protein NDU88_002112 [Pleurodeles waltl]|uniref:Uncharacterized protein n=1 Tax=Pleurodeles waltl TaxID=8319 RepID=A0AAV7T2C5_PLEWA|nr:hypothetical protein NDU88_002112 [Pleurodeles waltl]
MHQSEDGGWEPWHSPVTERPAAREKKGALTEVLHGAAVRKTYSELLEVSGCLNNTAHSANMHTRADRAGALPARLIRQQSSSGAVPSIRAQSGLVVAKLLITRKWWAPEPLTYEAWAHSFSVWASAEYTALRCEDALGMPRYPLAAQWELILGDLSAPLARESDQL